MNGEAKISIIVPCYNIEKLVASTVKTICNQTYQNLEIILVDDGSKDGTAKILDEQAKKDDRIRVIHKENGGVTSARLAGIRAATGDWIGFVDGDDAIEPDMYERLLRNAHKYNADISHCGYQMVFPSRVDYYYNSGRLAKQDKITGLKDLLSGEFIEPGLWNKLFHKNLFHNLLHDDVMDTSIKINEDLLMNFYLFRQAEQAVFEDFCPYHYMVRTGSAATSMLNESKLRDPLLVQKTIRSELEKNSELQSLFPIVDRRIAYQLVNLATMQLGEQADLIAHYRSAARKELRGMLPQILKVADGRLKAMSAWTAIWPTSYCWVHKFYAHIRGTDRKYEVS